MDWAATHPSPSSALDIVLHPTDMATNTLKCDHEETKGEFCPHCDQQIDAYGNDENSLIYCCFPNCGCDGSRLCSAESGASTMALALNIEGMYESNTPRARAAKMILTLASSVNHG